MAIKDISGNKYGKLTAVRIDGLSAAGHALWLFNCECGNELVAYATNVKTGKTQSCGCHRIEARLKHGASHSPEYYIWVQMRQRCQNRKNPMYRWYGAKGVRVCAEWDEYENFIRDIGPKPDGMSIDRINPFGDYEPENCRWATDEQQVENTRKNWLLSHPEAKAIRSAEPPIDAVMSSGELRSVHYREYSKEYMRRRRAKLKARNGSV